MYDLVRAFSRHYIKRSTINMHEMNERKKERKRDTYGLHEAKRMQQQQQKRTFLNNIKKLSHKYYIICMHENLLKSIFN